MNVNLESIVILCNWVDRMNSAKGVLKRNGGNTINDISADGFKLLVDNR